MKKNMKEDKRIPFSGVTSRDHAHRLFMRKMALSENETIADAQADARCSEKNQVLSAREIHAAGFLWAMIRLRMFFQEPLRTIAEKAADMTKVRVSGGLLSPSLGGICVAPPVESLASGDEEAGCIESALRMLLSEMGESTLDDANKASRCESEAKEHCLPPESYQVQGCNTPTWQFAAIPQCDELY